MKKGTKMQTVLVHCLNVDTDGETALDKDGGIASRRRDYLYTWERQRRSEAWLNAHPTVWKPITKAG